MPPLSITTTYPLLSGHSIPVLGYGVYQIPAAITESVVLHALRTGYRHIDSVRGYSNEKPCADAMRKAQIPRSDIFFTSKVPPPAMGYEKTKASIEGSLEETGLEHIDLYLVHAPYGGKEARRGTWLALVEAKRAGLLRSIGVSDYGVHHLEELETYIKELEGQYGKDQGGEISVGQWELHPWCARPDIVKWCEERCVAVQAYCPLVRGQRLEEEVFQTLAKKHDKTGAQILMRWSLPKGFVSLPKSVTQSRIEENANVYDFELAEDDMRRLETGEYSPCAWDPATSHD